MFLRSIGLMAAAAAQAIIPNADYHVVHGWPVLPDNAVLDEVSSVAVDSRGNVLAHYLSQWKGPPFVNPQDIAIGSDGTVFVTDIGEQSKVPDRYGVYVMRIEGSSLGRIGRRGNYDGQFIVAHGVAVGKAGEVYVADFFGRRVQKFLRGKE